MAVLLSPVYYSPSNPLWLSKNVSSLILRDLNVSTLNVSSILANSVLANTAYISSLTANGVMTNSTFTSSLTALYTTTKEQYVKDKLTLDTQVLTANATQLLLNGIPLATISNLSSLSQWSLDPAISDVQIAGYNICNANGIYGTSLSVTNSASIRILNSCNIVNSNDLMTNTIEVTRTATASNVLTNGLTVSNTATIATMTTSNTATFSNGANFYGTRPNFTTGINTSGANNFNNTDIDNASNIRGNVISINPQNNLNINTSNAMTVTIDRFADIGGSSVINMTTRDGAGTLISLNANSAHPNALTPTSVVSINAQGNVGLLSDAPYGGTVNITAERGLTGIGASVLGGGGINLTAYSYGLTAPGAIRESAGSILAYSGLTSPTVGIYGNSYYSALNCLSLTAGATPATTSFTGVVYLRGDNGTKVLNGFYTDTITATGNSVLPTINTYGITAPSGSNIALLATGNSINLNANTLSLYAVNNIAFTTPNITATGSMDIGSLTSVSSINGASYPPASGSGVWASTATTALNMTNHEIYNISNLSFRGGGFIKDYTPSIHLFDIDGNNCDQTRLINGSANVVLLPAGQIYFGGYDYYFQGNVHLMGHTLYMDNADIVDVRSEYFKYGGRFTSFLAGTQGYLDIVYPSAGTGHSSDGVMRIFGGQANGDRVITLDSTNIGINVPRGYGNLYLNANTTN